MSPKWIMWRIYVEIVWSRDLIPLYWYEDSRGWIEAIKLYWSDITK